LGHRAVAEIMAFIIVFIFDSWTSYLNGVMPS